MNPLPHVVLIALSICFAHLSGWGTVGDVGDGPPLGPNLPACIKTASCGPGVEPNWDDGYSTKCSLIYTKAVYFTWIQDMAKWKKEAAEAHRKAVLAAKKDQPALDKALSAFK